MAYTDQQDDNGAINTSGSDPNDNSGAAPVAAPPPAPQQQGGFAIDTSDNSGAAPVAGPPQQQSPSPGSVNSPSYGPLGGVADKIKKLLGGEGALNPALLDDATKKVDPDGKMSPADRQVAAIHTAYEQHGPDAAMALLQANRVAYGTKAAFARTALLGNAQKPGDLNAAIQAANQAQENLPDGSNVVFSHGGRNGITATVTMPGSSKPLSFNLSPTQFAQYLDVGKDGQFDKLMDVTAPAMLQRLVQANAGQPIGDGGLNGNRPQSERTDIPFGVNKPAAGAPQSADQGQQDQGGKKPYKWGENSPGSVDLSGETSGPRKPATNEELGIRDKELEGRARAMFPWASQETQRQQWMAQEEEKEAERENKLGVAAETGKNKIKVAEATGRSRENVAQTAAGAKVESSKNYSEAKIKQGQDRLAAAIAAEEGKNARSDAARAGRALNAKIAAGGYNSLTDKEKATFEKFLTPEAQAPQAPTPKAATPGATAPAKSQRSAKDQQAMAWAKANPNDPRAAQIMQRLNGAQ